MKQAVLHCLSPEYPWKDRLLCYPSLGSTNDHLRQLAKDRPEKDDHPDDYYDVLDIYYKSLDSATQRQDRYFKQAQTAAASLGLTISSRCKLVAPVQEEAPKENKFSKVGKAAGGK